jgi:hypothetical protein
MTSQKNLPAKPAMDRVALLSLMKPVNERCDPQQEAQNAALVAFELNIVSLKVGRFGWEQMDPAFKDRLSDDWVDVLRVFPIAEVKRGIGDCLEAFPRVCPTEQAVKAAIMKRRAKAVAKTPKAIPPPEPTNPETRDYKAESDRIMAEVMGRTAAAMVSKPRT